MQITTKIEMATFICSAEIEPPCTARVGPTRLPVISVPFWKSPKSLAKLAKI